jgi:ABC-type antimicrobial peptide transport system ATPase subunit
MEDRDISIVGFIELKIQLTEIKILVSRCIRNIHHWLTQIDVLYFGQAEAYDIALAKIIRNLYRPNVCFFTLPERINRQPLYFVGWQLFSATWQVAMVHHLKIPCPVFNAHIHAQFLSKELTGNPTLAVNKDHNYMLV